MATHYIITCPHGVIKAQCRCPYPFKTRTTQEGCPPDCPEGALDAKVAAEGWDIVAEAIAIARTSPLIPGTDDTATGSGQPDDQP